MQRSLNGETVQTHKDIRAELKNLMLETLADERSHHTWTYERIRPLTVPPTWSPGQHVIGDCSWGLKMLCRWAGAPDPMESGYGHYGNSQTIWLHAQHVERAIELEVGDVITFGYDGSTHATMVLEPGSDPLLWSFGHQGAPNTYRLSWDRRLRQFCKLPIPEYVPTPQDKLRAKTGWFAWVAWRLGEGDWKQYGKMNNMVRPNVPKVIPVSWWRMLAKFLLNRKKGNAPTDTPGV